MQEKPSIIMMDQLPNMFKESEGLPKYNDNSLQLKAKVNENKQTEIGEVDI